MSLSTELSTATRVYIILRTLFGINSIRQELGVETGFGGRGNKLCVIDRKRTVVVVDGGVEEFKSNKCSE